MTKFKIAIAFLLVVVVEFAHCGDRIDLILSGRDIPSGDIIWGETEPYVKVFYKVDSSSSYISYGQTTVSKNNPNPDWPQVFTFDYTGGLTQITKFELWDEDVIFHDRIGTLEIPLGQVVNGANSSGYYEYPFSPNGRGRLVYKVRINGAIG